MYLSIALVMMRMRMRREEKYLGYKNERFFILSHF